MTNLSMHGCAVESHTRVPTGTRLELCALFPKDHRPVVPDLAVVRGHPEGSSAWNFSAYGLKSRRASAALSAPSTAGRVP